MKNSNRKAFTMIELIFVIVIIGILAAVAVPKLAATTKEAHNANVIAFVKTMNRTAGVTMWSASIAIETGATKGQIATIAGKYCQDLDTYITLPSEVSHIAGGCSFTVNSPATGTITFTEGTAAEGPSWTYAP